MGLRLDSILVNIHEINSFFSGSERLHLEVRPIVILLGPKVGKKGEAKWDDREVKLGPFK